MSRTGMVQHDAVIRIRLDTPWSVRKLSLSEEKMAVSMGTRQAADEEARAEVEVLNSRLEKTRILNAKLTASLSRLEASGKSVTEAIGPIYGNTRNLQVLGTNIDGVISAIERIRQPSDIKSNEEDIIRKGPDKAGLSNYMGSVRRVKKALADLQQTNLRSNQQAVADLAKLLKSGNDRLQDYFKRLLEEDSKAIEPLHYITKDKPFPTLSQDKTTRLGLINSYLQDVARSNREMESPTIQAYVSVRGPYLTATLQNLAAASINTARKTAQEAAYRAGTNGMTMYTTGMQGAFLAEYDNICALFSRDEWSKIFNLTCQRSISELARTIAELNKHIKSNLNTDCYLAYEIVDVMSDLWATMESRTGELKQPLLNALKPIRETAKSSLGELLNDTRNRVDNLQTISPDGAAVPITTETMTRLQTMVNFLRPISGIMISIGDGGWKANAQRGNSSEQIPSLSSFDVSADGKQIFAHYCMDTIDTLLGAVNAKGKVLLKSKPAQGVFLANNTAVVERMIRTSELQPVLQSREQELKSWRDIGTKAYMPAWSDAGRQLMTAQRSQRPPSSSGSISSESAAILKSLNSKEKDAIKEKFKAFNTTFDALVSMHKSLAMEREIRSILAKQIQDTIEKLYGQFWERYHEIDKGKGKYVKYDKGSIAAVFLSLY